MRKEARRARYATNWQAENAKKAEKIRILRAAIQDAIWRLVPIHSALDEALGDSDVEYQTDKQLRERHPVQWAATHLIRTMHHLGKAIGE